MAINRDKILQEAQKLVDKKRYDKAVAEYQKVVADDPNDVRTLLKIGDLYLRMQQYADAITTYDRVANYYSIQGFSVKAVAVYKQIREIIQKHAPHLEDRFGHVVPKLAELLTQLDLRSDALAYYDEMATRLQVVGRERDAIDVFKKIVVLDPNNPVSHLRLADAYTRVRDFDGGSQEFGTAAEILVRIGRRDDALRVVERLLQYRQEPHFARMAAEMLLERAGPTDAMGALTKLQIAFKDNPRDLDTLALLARAFEKLGQPAKAIEVQKEAARIAKDLGNKELFENLLAILVRRAPNDEGVKQLVLLAHSDSKSSLPPASVLPASSAFGGSQHMMGLPGAQARPSSRAPGFSGVPPQQPTARPGALIDTLQSPQLQSSQLPQMPSSQMLPGARTLTAGPFSPQRSVTGQFAPERGPEPVSVVEEISVADLVVDEFDLEPPAEEPPSDDEPPFALRSSYPPAADADPVRDLMMRVEALRRAGDYESAAGLLREAITQHPTARELRERLCDVLIESGDQDAAVEEMLGFSRYLVDSGDPDNAARLLDEVLLLEPNNRLALSLLRSLGYAVPNPDDDVDPALASPAPPGYDPMAPLPSYDLEELTADELPIAASSLPMVPVTGEHLVVAPAPAGSLAAYATQLDEPHFAPSRGEPSPSSSPYHHAPPIQLDDPFAAESTNMGMPAYQLDEHVPPVRQSQPGTLDESALEEIEFFSTHGMLDEAETLLAEQLTRLPNHRLLLEKKREIAELRAQAQPASVAAARLSAQPSGTAARALGLGSPGPLPGAGAPSPAAPPQARVHAVHGVHAQAVNAHEAAGGPSSQGPRELTVDRAYDIAHALDEMDNAMESFGPREAPPQAGQISVEQVFEQFKAGVAAQIAEGDADTHYDLGVAYKEMGLIDDSIHEFELASRDPTRECVCQSMIGMLQLQNGNVDEAIHAFLRGLTSSQKNQEQELALTYEIGNAYEMRGSSEQALYYFQLVARADPSHRDPRGSVAERISALERSTGQDKPPLKAVAVGAGDEFDQAFDDLFNPKG